MSGSKTQPTQTTSTQQVLSPEQQQIMQLAMPGIKQFAANVPQRYQGNTVAGFTDAQTQGQNMVLGSAGAQQGIADNAADTSNFYTSGDIWNPSSNPNLQGAIDASVRPITENYQQVVEPGLRDEFTGAGQEFGGSRRNIAEGNAANSYMRNVGDTASKVAESEYNTNVDAQLKALGLTPQTASLQTAPGVTTSGVGDVQQAMNQANIGANVSNFNYDQLAPFLQSQELMSLLQGLPGGGTTSTSTGNNPGTNPGMSALGGAASGAALGGSLGGPIGAGVGALGGGLYGYLGSK